MLAAWFKQKPRDESMSNRGNLLNTCFSQVKHARDNRKRLQPFLGFGGKR